MKVSQKIHHRNAKRARHTRSMPLAEDVYVNVDSFLANKVYHLNKKNAFIFEALAPYVTHIDCSNADLSDFEFPDMPLLAWLKCDQEHLKKLPAVLPNLRFLSCAECVVPVESRVCFGVDPSQSPDGDVLIG